MLKKLEIKIKIDIIRQVPTYTSKIQLHSHIFYNMN